MLIFLSKNSRLDFFIEQDQYRRMTWNANRIKELRKRMGWTQSELARKLDCDSDFIREWEASENEYITDNVINFIDLHVDALVLMEKQADSHSEHVIQSALAETFLEEVQASQVHTTAVRRRFFEGN